MIMKPPVHGSNRRPASSGLWPSTICRSCATKKTTANSEANVRNTAALPAENAREEKNPSGSIGLVARRSQATNPAASTMPATRVAMTSGLPHPASPPRTSAQTTPSDAPVISATPG
jgi:hypothetical protein